MKYILRITGNYADEFDVMGIHEITEEQARFLIDTRNACFNSEEEKYFGTNEYVELNELDIYVEELSDSDFYVLSSILKSTNYQGKLSYGLIDLTDVIREAMNGY